MHLAAAMQTPIVALFGPSSEASWRPWQCPHELVLGDCPCKVTRQFICDKSRPYPCMERIQVDAVLQAAERVLQATAARPRPQGAGW
jgi:heptosyltransferase-3